MRLRSDNGPTLGLNLGHDAGVGVASRSGIALWELERQVAHKHACGAHPEAYRQLQNAIDRAKSEFGPPGSVAYVDYYSPATTLLPNYVHHLVSSPLWEKAATTSARSVCEVPSEPTKFGFDDGVRSFVVRHHWAHAWTAYYAAAVQDSAVLVLDGTASFAESGLIARGVDGRLEFIAQLSNLRGPRFGLVYEALAKKIFGSSFATGKLLGLAAHGHVLHDLVPALRALIAGPKTRRANPIFFDLVDERVLAETRLVYGETAFPFDFASDGFRKCATYADYIDVYGKLFPDGIEIGNEQIPFDFRWETESCKDIAKTMQAVVESDGVRFVNGLHQLIGGGNTLCFAGGCALNIGLNSKILEQTRFTRLVIPTCCNDSGVAVGAALAVMAENGGVPSPRRRFGTGLQFIGALLQGADTVGHAIERIRVKHPNFGYIRYRTYGELLRRIAERLCEGEVVCWVEGRCEAGPRALGHRSLLAIPTVPGMRRRISEDIKGRESFRPIAPMCLEESASQYFTGPLEHATTMLFSCAVRSEFSTELGEVVHCDGSVRLQVVAKNCGSHVRELLLEMKRLGRPPILINTSANGRDLPIANDVQSLFELFAATEIDVLVFVDQKVMISKMPRDG